MERKGKGKMYSSTYPYIDRSQVWARKQDRSKVKEERKKKERKGKERKLRGLDRRYIGT